MPDTDAALTLSSAWGGPGSTHGGEGYAEMIVMLRGFQDALAGSRPDAATIRLLTKDLDCWKSRLERCIVDEDEQVYGRRRDLVGRGQATWPAINFTRLNRDAFEAVVTLGRFFLGRNGAVHGGVVTMLFDEAAGRLAHSAGRTVSRTAYLKVDFRSVTPIDVELALRGHYIAEQGRKRLLHIELRHGETLCAEADVLMVALRPGQP